MKETTIVPHKNSAVCTQRRSAFQRGTKIGRPQPLCTGLSDVSCHTTFNSLGHAFGSNSKEESGLCANINDAVFANHWRGPIDTLFDVKVPLD